MGGMHTWLWGERYPTFMDALMPLASLPTQISGRNRVWRRVVIDAIRHDPQLARRQLFHSTAELEIAQEMLYLMSSNPVLRQRDLPTFAKSDTGLTPRLPPLSRPPTPMTCCIRLRPRTTTIPGLSWRRSAHRFSRSIPRMTLSIAELGILEHEIKRVSKGRAVVIPLSPETRGHGTHTIAAVWKRYLEECCHSRVAKPSAGAGTSPGRALNATKDRNRSCARLPF